MAPKSRIPPELKLRPFTLDEAKAVGITRTALRSAAWRRVGRGLYCWAGLFDDPWKILFAYQRLVPETVFAGRTAAWLYGLDVDPTHPIEVIVPSSFGIRSRPGLIVRHLNISSGEVTRTRGLRATTVYRALRDLCVPLNGVEALVVIDQALRLKLVGKADACHLHAFGALAEPAESPMETRLRWLLLKAGLPRPGVQTNLHDSQGRFVGRADIYYSEAGLVIEFDGANHRDRLVEDNRRQNLMIGAGYRLLRFTAADIYTRPETVTSQVRRILSGPAAVSARRPAAARR